MSTTVDTDTVDAGASTNHAESILSLIAHGGRPFKSAFSKYVVHTHTIPLATTVDQQLLLPEEQREGHFHGYASGEQASVHCPKRSCMFLSKEGKRTQEFLKKNCPCGEVALENGGLTPLCFMVYLRSMNNTLTGNKQPEELDWKIEPSEVMFCQNSVGIFDNSYPGFMRDRYSHTGWSHVSKETLTEVMGSLYWYRKYNAKYRFTAAIESVIKRRGIKNTKHLVMQTLHTINGILIKKFLAFAPEIEGYKNLARHTAWAFHELFKDYSSTSHYLDDGRLVEPAMGFYLDCKNFSNLVKQSFHRESREDRISWMGETFSTKAFGAFFGGELRRLKALVESEWSNSGSDYSLSPAFMYRCTILCQTRNMGYLPESIAYFRRAAFRATVNRQVEPIAPEIAQLQVLAVRKRLSDEGIPQNLLSTERVDKLSQEWRERSISIFSQIEMPLKSSASVDTFVKDGGKVEDARLLLRIAREQSWKIPYRDLNNHKILGYISVTRETDSETDFTRPLFWASYQLVLNHWILKSQWNKEDFSSLPGPDGKEYQPGIMDARIVHISEPGKERNLTKSHSCLAWFLTPGAKLTQATLALLPEHRAGLLESSHEWRHQQRIASTSDESGFIYDSATGKTFPEIRHVFKDWTESTDFISKMVGYHHLKAMMDYVGFPASYGRLILKTIVEAQPVTETSHVTFIEDVENVTSVQWKGYIREGFMMGNPMTKTILHLVHSSERIISEFFMSERGLKFRRTYKYGMFPNPARLDRRSSENDKTHLVRSYERI